MSPYTNYALHYRCTNAGVINLNDRNWNIVYIDRYKYSSYLVPVREVKMPAKKKGKKKEKGSSRGEKEEEEGGGKPEPTGKEQELRREWVSFLTRPYFYGKRVTAMYKESVIYLEKEK